MPRIAQGEKEYFSISELAHLLNATLETSFPRIRFEGEISECTLAKSGHLYMRLKDDTSQLEAVMWRGNVQTLTFKPERGVQVLCEGRPNLYAGSGKLQMVLSSMSPSGEGVLQKRFLELKAKLEKEGLFDLSRKRQLPFFPNAIGVVTSASGAVIHDIMVKIKERMPSLPVYLVDVRVQGEGAAHEIAEGIKLLNEHSKVDVMIVGRGGGSLEDLWAFNEEEVVRAIFASRIPVISSVGHESDVSLSDFAADKRAPTPTAAAEMVVPKRSDLVARIEELSGRLSEYSRWFSVFEQHVDILDQRLSSKMEAIFQHAESALKRGEASLKALHPQRILQLSSQRVSALEMQLGSALERVLSSKKNPVAVLAGRLEALNPYKVLKRGYSLVQKDGHVVSNALELKKNDPLHIVFGEGDVRARVE